MSTLINVHNYLADLWETRVVSLDLRANDAGSIRIESGLYDALQITHNVRFNIKGAL